MSDHEVRETAARRYHDWAARDAKNVSGEDYERLVDRMREAGEDGRKELVKELSDGELLWLIHVTQDPSKTSDPAAKAEALRIHTAAFYETVGRAFGPPDKWDDNDTEAQT